MLEESRVEKSIAVLPFVNMSSDQENDYFSDGITEEIINALTAIDGLKVSARTSSFSFKNQNQDIRKIANQLGVESILEGSVRKSNTRLRITAQLIRAEDGFHLWSKKYDRELSDLFEVQDEISLLIADKIRENFGHLEYGEALSSRPKLDVRNYQLYLKAKYHLNKLNPGDIESAIDILKGIIRSNKNSALVYVNIHYAYNILAASGLMPVKEALSLGKEFLDKAFKLNRNSAEVYHSLGWHALNWNWDFKAAKGYLEKAIDLRPAYAEAHQKMFITLALEGNLDQAYKHISFARELDPLSALTNYFNGYYYYLKKDFQNSNKYMELTFELEPSFLVAYSIYGLSLILQGKAEAIFNLMQNIPDIRGAEDERKILECIALSTKGETREFNERKSELKEELHSEKRERFRFFLIFIECFAKNYEAALSHIEEGIRLKEPLMTLLKVDPNLLVLHRFTRFQDAMKTIYALSDKSKVEESHKKKIKLLTPEESEDFCEKLKHFMQEEEFHFKESASLRMLAEALDLHPNKLSWLLNEYMGQNFNDFINQYRLDHFLEKVQDPNFKHMSLLGIAYESGFNSKSVFHSFFKKKMGLSPKDWLKQAK